MENCISTDKTEIPQEGNSYHNKGKWNGLKNSFYHNSFKSSHLLNLAAICIIIHHLEMFDLFLCGISVFFLWHVFASGLEHFISFHVLVKEYMKYISFFLKITVTSMTGLEDIRLEAIKWNTSFKKLFFLIL